MAGQGKSANVRSKTICYNLTAMNWLDIILLVLLALSLFQGLKRGLIKTVFSIIGVIVGVIIASRFYDNVSAWFGFADSAAFNVLSFIIIIAAVMVIAAVLSSMLRFAASAILLGWVDRLGGAFFGLLLGSVLLGAVISLWIRLFEAGVVAESAIASFLAGKFPLVLAILPADFDTVRDFFTRLLT